MKVKRRSDADIASDDIDFVLNEQLKQTCGRSDTANVVKRTLAAVVAAGIIVSRLGSYQTNSINLRQSAPPGGAESAFIKSLKESIDPQHNSPFLPIVITNDKVLCPDIEKNTSRYRRLRHFTQMLHAGLQADHGRLLHTYEHVMNGNLPLLLMIGDGIGCNVATRTDEYEFPRLTWSMPSEHHRGSEWCRTIATPSYALWNVFGKLNIKSAIEHNEHAYPWEKKIAKAVWRGSTTYDANQYLNVRFDEIPRARLVQASKDYPDIIDAAFTKIHQRFENMTEELKPRTIMAKRMPFDDQMKYKAIIDVDGNNWSSRYSRLLCSNSVVIKILPDFTEYFYDDLIPNVHYMPASLQNISEVASYVLDGANDSEMKAVVKAANSWCKRRMNNMTIAHDEVHQLELYLEALAEYRDHDSSHDEWASFVVDSEPFSTLVEC